MSDGRPLLSKRALAGASPAALRHWLRRGVDIWVADAAPSELVGAFAPLVLNPYETAPRQLVQAIDNVISEFKAAALRERLESVLADEIATWGYTNGVERGSLLLQLAGWLGCRDLAQALRAMLSRPVPLSPQSQAEMGNALAFALPRGVPPREQIGLLRRMRDRHLAPSFTLAQLVPAIAAADPSQLPVLLDEFFPDLEMMDLRAPHLRTLAHQLVDRLGLNEVIEVVFREEATWWSVCALLEQHRLSFEGEPDGRNFAYDRTMGSYVRLPSFVRLGDVKEKLSRRVTDWIVEELKGGLGHLLADAKSES